LELMGRHIQVTFDAQDPGALSSFWRDALGFVHPGPPGVEVPEGADPLAAWDEFLERAGVPKEQRNTRSAIEDRTGTARESSFSRFQSGHASNQESVFASTSCQPADPPRTGARGLAESGSKLGSSASEMEG
jgi:hypothetical protein